MPFGTLSKDMQLTEAEFASRLPVALEGFSWEALDGGYVAQDGGRTLKISIQPLPPRVLGLFSLPRCQVDLTFDGLSDDERNAFVARFDQIYQKGGG